MTVEGASPVILLVPFIQNASPAMCRRGIFLFVLACLLFIFSLFLDLIVAQDFLFVVYYLWMGRVAK